MDDADSVILLFFQAVAYMCANGIEQWDEVYPSADKLRGDISDGDMHVLERGGEVLAAVVVNESCDPEYAQGVWQYDSFAVVHRLCVHPKCQHQGIANEVMHRVEALADSRGYSSLRLDAFSLNPYALRLYEKRGYQRVGQTQFRKGIFYLYEKQLHDNGL